MYFSYNKIKLSIKRKNLTRTSFVIYTKTSCSITENSARYRSSHHLWDQAYSFHFSAEAELPLLPVGVSYNCMMTSLEEQLHAFPPLDHLFVFYLRSISKW